jgi:hypothetical protein
MNNYNIITLGASGSGKTVLLASLFKLLSIQGEHGFFIEIENSQKRNYLNNIYTEIISGETWPHGTKGEVTQWTFTCCVKTPDISSYPACQFTYFDYAGGLLTDAIEKEEQEDFHKKVNDADAVLVIIDGLKVLDFMQDNDINNKDVLVFLTRDLPSILQVADDYKKDTPVHFIISKWDLLATRNYTLLEVRHRLLEKVPEFRNVVHSRNKANCPVRLIPVSSVGMGFATLQPDGQMKKNPGTIPHPFQVEVPLACVLIDGLYSQLQSQINRLKIEQKEISQKPTEVKSKFDFIDQVEQFFSSTVLPLSTGIIRQFLPDKYKFDNNTLKNLIEVTESGVEKIDLEVKKTQDEIAKKKEEAAQETEKRRREQAELLKQVKNEETALNYTVNIFIDIKKKLDQEFPASDLKGVGV